eukprot:TRINITY_DN20108_c0_g1_i1.p1 TRINITY_DN20108_c0_g1~~TRINITY_DN20108_c0_g1_i1.p1  ORF type:complete len:364 (-),score=4.72 TRINITY_DN20108_c0_g1_i1:17-1081(-)
MNDATQKNNPMEWRTHFARCLQLRNQKIDEFCTYFEVEKDRLEAREERTCFNCSNSYVKYETVQLVCKHIACVYCCDGIVERTRNLPSKMPRNHKLSVLDGLAPCPCCCVPSIVDCERQECQVGFRKLIHTTFTLRENFSKDIYFVVEHIYENQRKWLTGYSSANLMASDLRGPWSTEDGDAKLKEDFKLPNPAWEWIGDWNVAREGDVDNNGWHYAWNWPGTGIMSKDSQWYSEPFATTFVRRRRWDRLRIRLGHGDMVKINRHRPLSADMGGRQSSTSMRSSDLLPSPSSSPTHNAHAQPSFASSTSSSSALVPTQSIGIDDENTEKQRVSSPKSGDQPASDDAKGDGQSPA